MNRRSFLGAAGAAALAGLPARAQNGKPWNILMMFSDDHAWQAVSAYGGKLNHTPNIDRIAHQGMRFDQCLVTNSICAPSRAVVLTGKHSHLNGVIDNKERFDPDQQTFPKLLQKAGYQTAMFGKWHLKSDPTGFDTWEVLPGQGSYYNPDFLRPSGTHRREGYVTDIIGDISLDWLKNGRDPNKPFLMFSQHKAPHRNWMPAPNKFWMYEGENLPEPETLFDNYENRASPARNQEMEIDRHMRWNHDMKVPEWADRSFGGQDGNAEWARMTPEQKKMWDAAYGPRNAELFKTNPQGRDLVRWKYQRYIKDYLRCISSVDDNVGRVLSYLDSEGLAENTLVVYSSDQGFYLGEHGWFDKRWIYEESLRTPLLMRMPGVIAPGSVNRDLVSNLDLAETFLDVGRQPIPSDMQGASMLPLLRGERPKDWRQSFYFHYYEKGVHSVAPHDGVRTNRFTLAHFYETDEWELYDLTRDPQQMRSVYADDAYQSTVKELKTELIRLRKLYKVDS
jgi:arylsulfatase A-like enzyme